MIDLSPYYIGSEDTTGYLFLCDYKDDTIYWEYHHCTLDGRGFGQFIRTHISEFKLLSSMEPLVADYSAILPCVFQPFGILVSSYKDTLKASIFQRVFTIISGREPSCRSAQNRL